jgi:hypothetical protein
MNQTNNLQNSKIGGDGISNDNADISNQTNNFHFSNSKPLNYNKNIKIKALKAVGTTKDFLSLVISCFTFSLIITLYLHFNYFDTELEKVEFLYKFLITSTIFLIPSISAILLARYIFPSTLILDKQSITIKKGKNETGFNYNYKEIRHIEKKDELIGYTLFIYLIDQKDPAIRFSFDSFHDANIVHDFVNNKISIQQQKKDIL